MKNIHQQAENLRESSHTQSVYYFMCNPVRKAYIMCWCSHHCSIFSHKPPKDEKSTPRFFSYFYQGTHYQLLSENNTGEAKLWASPMCLTINCYPHKQKYLAIGTIWPVFLPGNVSHSITASSDEVCIDMAKFFQKSGGSSAYSCQAIHRLLQSLVLYVMSDHTCT